MSAAELPRPKSLTLADAAGRDERIVLHCLMCQHAAEARAAVFLQLLGALPFGMVIDKLRCSRCRDNLGVVLPWWAPTPRLWAAQYAPAREPEPIPVEPPADAFGYRVDIWDDRDRLQQTTTLTREPSVGYFAFDLAAKAVSPEARVTMRTGLRLLRDSRRDFRVVR